MITIGEMQEHYHEVFGGDNRGLSVARAPGRVNLIGGHTDYNEGFVLPMALESYVWAAAKGNEGDTVNLYAVDFDEKYSFNLDDAEFDENHPWANYVMGVADEMRKKGHRLGGVNMVIKGDVPKEVGLSSSAAIEIATAKVFASVFNEKIDPVDLAYIGKSAENNFVGVQCGVMDQFVSVLGRPNHTLFIDCRTNQYSLIPFDPSFSVAVVNTTVKRDLASSAYNERKSQCEEGVRVLRRSLPSVRALRDVSLEELEKHRSDLSNVVFKRCRHVISENARVLEAVEAQKKGDIMRLGELMYESHFSLRDDYEVSCLELDILLDAARGIRGTLGARMTGAGFGGCTVNILRKEYTESFIREIKDRYKDATGLQAEVYIV